MSVLTAATPAATSVRRSGAACLVAGLLGAASGVYLAALEPVVADDRFSYPQDAGPYITIQGFFVLQHLGLLAGLVALARSGVVLDTRAGRLGRVGAIVSMVGLTVTEAVAMLAADVTLDSTTAAVVGGMYGVVTVALGITLLTAGVAIARATTWRGWRRWLVLAMGVWVFVPMLPALAVLTDGARLAIAGWMLLFAALGAALVQHPGPEVS